MKETTVVHFVQTYVKVSSNYTLRLLNSALIKKPCLF